MTKDAHSCPRCTSTDVSRSRRKGIIDKIMSFFGRYPYRCEEFSCRKRFYLKSK